jgi:aminoglycoside 3-N-acetyltransferase I
MKIRNVCRVRNYSMRLGVDDGDGQKQLEAGMSVAITQLKAADLALMHGLLDLFAAAFDEAETYRDNRPDDAYLRGLLASDTFIVLVAVESDNVVGGLAAYELKKFEQARSEIYVYDLAVAETHRRQGIATSLLRELCAAAPGAWDGRRSSGSRGAHAVFVQADRDDAPAVALYSGLGRAEPVLHFDLSVGS